MIAEYIKREDVIALAWGVTYIDEWHIHKSDKVVSVSDIAELPSADVVERKHGKWEDGGFVHETPTYYKSKICSVCGYSTGNGSWHYCPICGADMRGDDNDGRG